MVDWFQKRPPTMHSMTEVKAGELQSFFKSRWISAYQIMTKDGWMEITGFRSMSDLKNVVILCWSPSDGKPRFYAVQAEKCVTLRKVVDGKKKVWKPGK